MSLVTKLVARRLLAAAGVLLCFTVATSAHAADDVDVIFRCASWTYPPSTGPITACGASTTCYCKVYWANQGAARTNVDFTVYSGELPDVPLIGDWDPAGGDLTFTDMGPAIGSGPVNVNGHWTEGTWLSADGTRLERTVMQDPFRDPWVPWGPMPSGYSRIAPILVTDPLAPGNVSIGLRLLDMPVGATGDFTFSFNIAAAFATTSGNGNVTLRTTWNGETTAADQVSVVNTAPLQTNKADIYGGGAQGFTTVNLVKGFSAFGGRGAPDGWGSVYTSIEHVIFLPYEDDQTGDIVSDGNYEPGLDTLILDVSVLTARGTVLSGWSGWTNPDVADYDYPVTDVIYVEPDTNRLTFRSGYFGHYWTTYLNYSAPLLPAYDDLRIDNATIPNNRSFRVYEDPNNPILANGQFQFVPVPVLDSGIISFGVLNSQEYPNDDGGWPWFAALELAAVRADGILRTGFEVNEGRLSTFATLGPLEDVTMMLQMPGSDVSAAFNDTTVGKDFDLVQLMTTANGANAFHHEIWVSDAAGDCVPDDNLVARDLIDAGDLSWRLCVSGTGALTCNAAALTAASVPFALSAVQHVKLVYPLIPQTSPGSTLSDIGLGMRSIKTSTLRTSIDGSTFAVDDASHAAAGQTASLSFELGGATLSATIARPIENDPRLRPGVGIQPNHHHALVYDGQVLDLTTTIGQERFAGCGLVAYQEASVLLPATFTIDLAPGFMPNGNPVYSLLEQSQPGGTGLVNRTTTSSYDPNARRYTITVDADNELTGQDLPASNYALWVSIPGRFEPGTPDVTTTSCRVQANYIDINGASQPFARTAVSRYTFTGTSPSLLLGAAGQPSMILQGGSATFDISLENEAFDDVTGGVKVSGATGAADEVAMYFRVPKEGDFPTEEGGNIAVAFASASSVDASEIWVSTAEAPTRTSANVLAQTPGWVLCASAPNACDATALINAGVSAPVRWVAFRVVQATITDAAPRSSNPGPGLGHLDNPYIGSVVLNDLGTTPDPGEIPKLMAFVEARSLDSATPAVGDAQPISIVDCIPSDTIDDTCDNVDDDCDGTNDDDYATTETCTTIGGCVGVFNIICQGGDPVPDGACAVTLGVIDVCNGIDDDCDTEIDENFAPQPVSCGVDACAVGMGETTCSATGVPGTTCDELWSDIPDTTCGAGTSGLNVAYIIVTDAVGAAIGSIRCAQDLAAPTTPVVCDTDTVTGELTIYTDLLCEGVAP